MIARPAALDEIVAQIADAVQPWRIILFGSRARGNHRAQSDYDLFVEVDDSHVPLAEIHDQIRKLTGASLTYDLKVKRPGEIERRRDDPGTIEWDVAREGRVLYAAPNAPVNLNPRRVAEPSPLPPESTHGWIHVAEHDLRHARFLIAKEDEIDDYSPDICWLSHQACEKYLKALIVSRRVRPERTHDLPRLLNAARACGCSLTTIDDDCTQLNAYSITARYPAGLDLGPEKARRAFAAANRVFDAIRAELQNHRWH